MRRFPDEQLTNKIIFLDIDGVLNHELHFKEQSQKDRRAEVGDDLCDLNPSSIIHLNHIIEETGADVIISSTWRKYHSSDELQALLDKVGFKGKIIGRTPTLSYKGYDGHPNPSLTVPRGCEIKAWMDVQYDYKESKTLNYLILDDDRDMLYWQKDAFIPIDSYCGLTPSNAYHAINILNQSRDELEMV